MSKSAPRHLERGGTNESTDTETDDIAVDVAANDLVLIGTDNQGDNHYLDVQRQRILVVDTTHEEYTRGAAVRRRLVAEASEISHIQTDGDTEDLLKYILFVDRRVDGREWESVIVDLIDTDGLLAGIGGV